MEIYNLYKDGRYAGYYTEEEDFWSTGGHTGMLPKWITPSRLFYLSNNEIFVFGTGRHGRHDHGASLSAVKYFGAKVGQAEGLQGQSYAIISTVSLEELKVGVDRFTQFAREHPELVFYITPIGCSYAGHTPEEVAPMFSEASRLPNTYLPLSFWQVLTKRYHRKTFLEYLKEVRPEEFKGLEDYY